MRTLRRTLTELPHDAIAHLNTAAFFTSTGFTQLWGCLGGREVYWVTEEDGRILAILPAVEFGHGPLRRLQAMPDGCYAEIIILADTATDRRRLAQSMWQAIVRAGYLKVYLTDYLAQFQEVKSAHQSEQTTIRIDISAQDWQPEDKKIRSEIRKAEREGVTIERFDLQGHFDAFLMLMLQTEKRHGRQPRYSRQFFHELAGLSAVDDRVHWVVIRHKSSLAASHIYFVIGDTLLNWQVHYDKAFSFLKPNQYVLYMTAKEMAGRGLKYLNLGASPPGAEGLAKYKLKWGGEEYRYRCLQTGSWLGRLL